MLGGFLSALAIGMRSQGVADITVARARARPARRRGAAGAMLGSAMTFPIGVLIWAVPS